MQEIEFNNSNCKFFIPIYNNFIHMYKYYKDYIVKNITVSKNVKDKSLIRISIN